MGLQTVMARAGASVPVLYCACTYLGKRALLLCNASRDFDGLCACQILPAMCKTSRLTTRVLNMFQLPGIAVRLWYCFSREVDQPQLLQLLHYCCMFC